METFLSSAGNLNIDFSTNGGSSYLNSGMQNGLNYNLYNTATLTNVNSTSTGIITSSNGGNVYVTGHVFVHNAGQGAQCQFTGECIFPNGSGNTVFGKFFGNTLTNSVNAVKFTPSAGNITGTITMYGII
jgi:hypothetical protein